MRVGGSVRQGPLPGWCRRVACDSSGVGPRLVCLGNESSGCARRRRSGARCWLDQELVRPVGRDSSQTCRAVSLLQTGVPDPTSRRISRDACRQVDYVVGVDTHRDQHALAVVAAPTGAVIAQTIGGARARAATRTALRFRRAARARRSRLGDRGHRPLRRRACPLPQPSGARRCSRSSRTSRGERRLRGKDDPLDAVRAARAALASETLGTAASGRAAGGAAAAAARSAQRRRRTPRVALVQLRSVIVTAPDGLRDELRRLPLGELLDRCSRFRRSSSRTPDAARDRARAAHARPPHPGRDRRSRRARARDPRPRPRARPRTARRARRRPDRRRPTDRHLVTPRPRPLRSLPSPASPASHRSPPRAAKRPATDSAAAATANSTAPSTPSSSTAANTTPPPSDYIARRVAEGKTSRDATRLLKRYLARHLYRVMQNSSPLTT